jgi:hypothetical protein
MSTTFIIADLAPEVIARVENRTSDLNRADIWLRDTLLEISGNADYRDEFDNLEVLGPTANLTPNVQEYPFSLIITSGDYNLSTLDVMVWTDFPTNQIRKKLIPSNYQDTDRFVNSVSIPAEWYRFADTIGFNPTPNQPYQVQARFLMRHPINDAALDQTQILLPREWNEILIWTAAERGFMELLEYEKAATIHKIIFGDPENPTKPGLVNGVKKRRRLEAWRDTVPLRPVIRGYGYGSS